MPTRTHKPLDLDDHAASDVAELFRALSDTSRIKLLATLIGGETNVGALAEAAGISESAVSHHMRHLRQLRMVHARKDGRQVYYVLDDRHIIDLFLRGVAHIQSGD
jgi:ArsR family transcriptional regulator, lead/cadmium/zinc/bismuth-responsive transcriptional repressor